jgi:hypothetical protein
MTKLFADDLDDEPEIVIPEDDPLKPFLEKYKDPLGIAKSFVEKERFIKQLQGENAGLRVEAVTRKSVEETVDRLLNKQKIEVPNTQVETDPASQQNRQPTSTGLSLEDVEKLLDKKTQEAKAVQNSQYVRQELEKLYGNVWVDKVKAKAKELGESVEFIDTLAQTKPQVLLKLFQPQQTQAAPKASLFNSSVNTTQQTLGNGASQERTMKFYNDLRNKDRNQYMTPKVQNQMHQDALRLGEAFFDV